MRFTALASLTAACLWQTASADFNIYSAGIGGTGIAGNAWGWQVYDGDANCDNALDWIWGSESDVSRTYGVRCSGGCGSAGDATDIYELEMNPRSSANHFTLYRERNWGLFDLNDNQFGSCTPVPQPEPRIICGHVVGQTNAVLKFRCTTTNGLNAAGINANRP